MRNESVLPKLLVALFTLAAVLSLFFTWVKIDVPILGTVYKLSGFQITQYIPTVLLSIVFFAFIGFIFAPVKRIVSVGTASINIIAAIIMGMQFASFKDNDTILKYLKNLPAIDSIIGSDFTTLAASLIKYESVGVLTAIFILLSFILSFFINDKY